MSSWCHLKFHNWICPNVVDWCKIGSVIATWSLVLVMQDSVAIEYAYEPDYHVHQYHASTFSDMCLPISLLGISPSSKQFIYPDLEVLTCCCLVMQLCSIPALAYAWVLLLELICNWRRFSCSYMSNLFVASVARWLPHVQQLGVTVTWGLSWLCGVTNWGVDTWIASHGLNGKSWKNAGKMQTLLLSCMRSADLAGKAIIISSFCSYPFNSWLLCGCCSTSCAIKLGRTWRTQTSLIWLTIVTATQASTAGVIPISILSSLLSGISCSQRSSLQCSTLRMALMECSCWIRKMMGGSILFTGGL